MCNSMRPLEFNQTQVEKHCSIPAFVQPKLRAVLVEFYSIFSVVLVQFQSNILSCSGPVLVYFEPTFSSDSAQIQSIFNPVVIYFFFFFFFSSSSSPVLVLCSLVLFQVGSSFSLFLVRSKTVKVQFQSSFSLVRAQFWSSFNPVVFQFQEWVKGAICIFY